MKQLSDASEFGFQYRDGWRVDVSAPLADFQLRPELGERTDRDPYVVPMPQWDAAGVALGDVRGDRNRSAPHLAGELEAFGGWKAVDYVVEVIRHVHCDGPGVEIAEALDRHGRFCILVPATRLNELQQTPFNPSEMQAERQNGSQ